MTTAPAAGAASVDAAPVLAFVNLSKSFGGEQALDGVDFTVNAGEVHGLLGQNGSGKSTLIKILAGYHAPEPGAELFIGGEPVSLPMPPGGFRAHGVSFVHQHLGLIPSLSALENLWLGELANQAQWRISWRRLKRRALDLFDEFGLVIDPDVAVSKLSPVQRALLAIVRAVVEMRENRRGTAGGVLILDEPTPFLPKHDVDQLFALIRDIVADGASVVFVSHDVDEVLEITDRATVLRDGRVAGTLVTGAASKSDFVELIVGRKVSVVQHEHRRFGSADADVVIEALRGGTVDGVDIALHRGEVIGLTGLIGSGYDEVPYLVFGAQPTIGGRMRLGSRWRDLVAMEPARAIREGVVLIPGDRQNLGAVGTLSVADNAMIPVLASLFNPWGLNRRGMIERTRALNKQFEVRPNDPNMLFDALSGGNQQKVLLSKWMQTGPELILLDEPTQGVDIGARQTVFEAILDMAGQGAAVLCASSDYEQLASICDRVLVFSRGTIATELKGGDVTKDAIAEACYHSVASALRTPVAGEAP